jgi:HTH-type transcriptional regulator/antitoxin HigA
VKTIQEGSIQILGGSIFSCNDAPDPIAYLVADLRSSHNPAGYIPIKDDEHYEEALELIESLLEEAKDSPDDPINSVIDLVGRAIENHENRDRELAAFEKRAMEPPIDLAMHVTASPGHRRPLGDLLEFHGVPRAFRRAHPAQESHQGTVPALEH